MILVFVSFTIGLHYIHCANILGVFPFPSRSHQIFFQAIWRELSLRGHNVTVVTTDPLGDSSLTNLTEIDLSHIYQINKQNTFQKGMSKNVFQNLYFGLRYVETISKLQFTNEEFQQLIRNKDNKFDLILVESYFCASYILSEKFKAPVIGISSLGVLTSDYDAMGSPSHQLLNPDLLLPSYNNYPSFWEKIRNVLYGAWSIYYHYYCVLPTLDIIVQKYLGNDITKVKDSQKNLSILFVNTNPLLYSPRPNVPAIVETGSVHIKPIKPLPKDLQKFLDESQEGVVYFSLGSTIKSVYINKELINVITQALSELPYKVIWKWESDFLPNKPPNVIIRKWLPQQDILAHPNVRAFVTQGGIQSIEEAIDRAVPMVTLPFISDQPSNAQKITKRGFAKSLNPMTLTKEELKESILEVSKNKTYKTRIREVKKMLFDRQMNGIEKVIWWSEYVIRHKGAKHLRSPSADISWFDYLILDVFGVAIITMCVVTCGSYKLAKLVF